MHVEQVSTSSTHRDELNPHNGFDELNPQNQAQPTALSARPKTIRIEVCRPCAGLRRPIPTVVENLWIVKEQPPSAC
jgi:hypothetical protein